MRRSWLRLAAAPSGKTSPARKPRRRKRKRREKSSKRSSERRPERPIGTRKDAFTLAGLEELDTVRFGENHGRRNGPNLGFEGEQAQQASGSQAQPPTGGPGQGAGGRRQGGAQGQRPGGGQGGPGGLAVAADSREVSAAVASAVGRAFCPEPIW